jgi:hypothetical protein
MNLSAIIELSAAAFGLYSGVFFCVGVLHVKDSTLEIIAVSVWEKGITIATELAQQRSDFIFGAALLFLSFLLQIVVKLLSQEAASIVVAQSQPYGVALGFGVPTIVLLLLYIPYRHHRRRSVRNLMAAVKGKL